MSTFGKRFREYRQSKGVSAYRISKLIGVHPSYLSNIEADRRPMSSKTIEKICSVVPEMHGLDHEIAAWQIVSSFTEAAVKRAAELV